MNGAWGRRTIVAALIVVTAGLAAFSAAPSASAKDAQKMPDYTSKADFQLSCELLGGTFMEDGLGNTECHYPDGSWAECDANGQDCWYTPGRPAPPVEIGDGTIPSAPIVDGPDKNGDGASASEDGDSQPGKAKHREARKGKKHGHGGKRHRH